MNLHRIVPAVALLVLACDRPSQPAEQMPAALERTPPSTLVRLPRAGGTPSVYILPELTEADWKAEERIPAVADIVGAISDPPQALFVDTRGRFQSLGLLSGRVRSIIGPIERAAMAPDGSLFAVDSTGRAFSVGRRTPERYQHEFAGAPDALFTGAEGRLIAVDTAASALEVLGPSDTLRVFPVGTGTVSFSNWGDAAAVVSDSGVLIYRTGSSSRPGVLKVARARAVEFSPSGHQLYVATADGQLQVFDRYGLERLRTIKLPGSAGALRAGPFGRWLLAADSASGLVWAVDLDNAAVVGSVTSPWSLRMPLITSPNVLLAIEDSALVARDLTSRELRETGRVPDVGAAYFVPVAWSPVRLDRARQALAADSAAPLLPDSSGSEPIFLQVSSSQNPSWARELASKLVAAGLTARVLDPGEDGEPYRVVLGPFGSREEAEAAGRTLGMPNFVISVPRDQLQ